METLDGKDKRATQKTQTLGPMALPLPPGQIIQGLSHFSISSQIKVQTMSTSLNAAIGVYVRRTLVYAHALVATRVSIAASRMLCTEGPKFGIKEMKNESL